MRNLIRAELFKLKKSTKYKALILIYFHKTVLALHKKGITILISSHMLHELSLLATCYGFINKGKMIEQISSEEIAVKGGNLEQYYLSLIESR